MNLFSSKELAYLVRKERLDRRLTQEQVAKIVVQMTNTKSCTKQAVSQAESETSGSKLDGLRIKIIEALTGKKIIGPLWRFENDEN
jgi:transcriptional regulator with XRE-family HTH domain